MDLLGKFEGALSIEITTEEVLGWAGRTLGDVVDTLLAKCKPPSVD